MFHSVVTEVHGDYEWHDGKAASNLEKHGVAFPEAVTALEDPDALWRLDEGSEDEGRWQTIGMSLRERVLFVVTTERGARIRVISARRAEPEEENDYYAEDIRNHR